VAGQLGDALKTALARWALTKRRDHLRAQPPDPRDEATHPWEGRNGFSEEYSFAMLQGDLGLVARLEWLPQRGLQRAWVVLLRPDGVDHLVETRTHGRTDAVGDRWRAGGLALDCVRPFREWVVRFTGHLTRGNLHQAPIARRSTRGRMSLELTFTLDDRPYWPGNDDDPELVAEHLASATWDAGLYRAVRRHGVRGYVQTGVAVGTLAYADELVRIRAPALRQHYWGARSSGEPEHLFQCFFTGMAPRTGSGFVHHSDLGFAVFRGGFVDGADARRESLRTVAVSGGAEPRSESGRVELELTHVGGRTHVSLESACTMSVPVDGGERVDFSLGRSGDGSLRGLWVRAQRPGRPPGASAG
jgi:hypothetical protein